MKSVDKRKCYLNRWQLVGSGLLVLAITLVGLDILFPNLLSKNAARRELIEFFDRIQTNQAAEQVESSFRSLPVRHIRLFKLTRNQWVVRTPFLSGASNWLLWIDFESGKVTRVRIRLEDNANLVPKNAPPDKGSKNESLDE